MDPFESGIFCSLINSTLYTKTYTPNLGASHLFIGSGLNEQGQRLQLLSSSALIDSVKEGAICSSDNSKYWTFDPDYTPGADIFDTVRYDFEVAFNQMDIAPTGKLLVNYKYELNGTFGSLEWLRGSLWARKGNNPSLSGDILIGETANNQIIDVGIEFGDLIPSLSFNINEGGRSSWQPLIPNLMVSFSGRLEHGDQTDPLARWKMSGLELMSSGLTISPTGTAINTNFDLYMGGQATHSGNFDIFTFSETPSGDIPLYMIGHSPASGNFNIYMDGSLLSSGNFDISALGHEDSTSSVLLFIKTVPTGSGNSGPEMFISGPSQLPFSGIIPIVVYQDTNPFTTFDLFIQNDALAANSGFNIYLAAPSGTDGAIPFSGMMPMFIARDSESIDAGMNLYIGGPLAESSGFNMYIDGTNSLTGSFDIIMSGKGTINNLMNVYIHGF